METKGETEGKTLCSVDIAFSAKRKLELGFESSMGKLFKYSEPQFPHLQSENIGRLLRI